MTAGNTDVVVVGGGAAGLQTALVLARSRRRVVVVDGGEPRNARAHAVHNLAGHEGVAPGDLLARARADARRYGARIEAGSVVGAERAAVGEDGARGTGAGRLPRGVVPRWVVRTSGPTGEGAVLRARALVLATGVVEDLPPVEGLAALWGTDVVSCPYCHGWEAQGRAVAIVGGGARAWQQLLLLRRFTDDLTLVSNGPTGLGADEMAQLRRWGVAVREDPVARVVAEGGRLLGVEFGDGELRPFATLFAATARRQASTLAARIGCAVSGAAVVTDADGYTGVAGVWAVGTCAWPGLTVAGAMGHATTSAIALDGALLREDVAADFPAGAAG